MLLSMPQVMKALGLSRPVVKELIDSGRLPATNLGTGKKFPRYFVRSDDLAEFVKPDSVKKQEQREQRRRRLDADVPKVF